MADFVLNDAFVSINGVDLSDHVEEVRTPIEVEAVEDTAMGDGSRSYLSSFKNWQLEVVFQQDFAAASVDATIFPLLGTSVPIIVRPKKATVIGATNPEFRGTGTIFGPYAPIAGRVGELAKASITVRSNGSVMTRNIV
jgi:hypothetical protein